MKLSDIPNLLKEFHLTKNGDLKPINLSYESSKKVWWKCDKADDHQWEALVNSRAVGKDKCPFCSLKKPSSTHNLFLKHPDIISEWNFEKNRKLSIKTNDSRQMELRI